MAVELRFRKEDATPWGFRLTGGADYETPLTVVKVTENSLAENAGMQVGDAIVRINDVSTTKLTHAQAHDVILKAGNEFVLGVRRSGSSNLPRQSSSEITSKNEDVGKATSAEKEDADLNITDEEIADIIGEPLQNLHAVKESEVLQAVAAEDEENKLKEKKWSTFLQKPKNPIPKPRKPVEEGPKAPPYRVIIKKQPKKGQETTSELVVTGEETKPEHHQVEEEEEEEGEQEDEKAEGKREEEEEEEERQSDEDAEPNQESPKLRSQSEDEEEEEDELRSPPEPQEDDQESSLKESDIRRMSASLEEQLVQVQKQLLALSKLPSAIQSTLNAVTQQLELIVNITQHEEEIIQVVEEDEGGEEVDEEKALSTLDEEEASDLAESGDEEARGGEIRSESSEEVEREEESQIMTEEEIEAQREEQERLEKREKEHRRMDRKSTLTPLERPIILPGGRRWVQPDDAVSKIRRPSMTDERIADTINTYSEIIVNHWNHIWPWSDVSKPVYRINFLKYQPPPKNLDHLQRSDVYRMIHDMEPPIRGVKARETKVLAEQDYYAKKEETATSLSPQMER